MAVRELELSGLAQHADPPRGPVARLVRRLVHPFLRGTPAPPHAATTGATASVVLSPTPPVECLSTTRRLSCAARSTVSPLATMAMVSANVSTDERPRNQTAMSSAAAW